MIKFNNQQFKNCIQKCLQVFNEEYFFRPVIGLELEFYVSNKKNIALLEKDLSNKKIHYTLTKETGDNQYEVQLTPSMQIFKTLSDLAKIKRSILKIPSSTLAAKPFIDQPGSALHLHLNFVDRERKNLFDKLSNEEETSLLLNCIAGLLDTLPEAMYFFAPTEKDYARYQASIDTPSNISWGNNNRTVSIRIPGQDSGSRRIEHRVASAATNQFAVCAVIFAGCLYGIQNALQPAKKIYGNAYLPQYKLESLPSSLGISYSHLISKKILLSFMN